MNHHIHIFGASGSGTTTLGRELSKRIGGKHLDTDSYYWQETDPPFTLKRRPADRINSIESDVAGVNNWVLSGSLCSWGEPLVVSFNLAIFIYLDPGIRMQRLQDREFARFGNRIKPGGDMYESSQKFLQWAKSYDTAVAPIRSLDLHRQWLQTLNCDVLELDSINGVDRLCDQVLERLADN